MEQGRGKTRSQFWAHPIPHLRCPRAAAAPGSCCPSWWLWARSPPRWWPGSAGRRAGARTAWWCWSCLRPAPRSPAPWRGAPGTPPPALPHRPSPLPRLGAALLSPKTSPAGISPPGSAARRAGPRRAAEGRPQPPDCSHRTRKLRAYKCPGREGAGGGEERPGRAPGSGRRPRERRRRRRRRRWLGPRCHSPVCPCPGPGPQRPAPKPIPIRFVLGLAPVLLRAAPGQAVNGHARPCKSAASGVSVLQNAWCHDCRLLVLGKISNSNNKINKITNNNKNSTLVTWSHSIHPSPKGGSWVAGLVSVSRLLPCTCGWPGTSRLGSKGMSPAGLKPLAANLASSRLFTLLLYYFTAYGDSFNMLSVGGLSETSPASSVSLEHAHFLVTQRWCMEYKWKQVERLAKRGKRVLEQNLYLKVLV